MVEASATSAVSMTLFGHMEDSQALEIEPFFSLPLLKRSVSSATQKLRFNQASSNMRLLSGPMKFNFHQCNKGEFSFVEHLNKAKARISFFLRLNIKMQVIWCEHSLAVSTVGHCISIANESSEILLVYSVSKCFVPF